MEGGRGGAWLFGGDGELPGEEFAARSCGWVADACVSRGGEEAADPRGVEAGGLAFLVKGKAFGSCSGGRNGLEGGRAGLEAAAGLTLDRGFQRQLRMGGHGREWSGFTSDLAFVSVQ